MTIVGASLAGLRGAQELRRQGFDGSITLIGDEQHQPYDRPPLSKQVLAGEWDPVQVDLVDEIELDALELDLRLGARATSFDLTTRRLTFEGRGGGGDELTVDRLLVATGARCRTLPGTEGRAGLHVLRSLDDCLALRADLESSPSRVVVIGAGFIGAEVAATARGRGLEVTVIEAEPTPLARALGPRIGQICAEIHRDHGIDLRTRTTVDGVDGDSHVTGVTLGDGSRVDADVVVVGIGVVPNTEWLEGSGLTIDDGVVCDQTCLAGPGVAAAGDVARWSNPRFGASMRVEHWDNAGSQGAHAARRLLAHDAAAEPYAPVPWFWSDQYDRKIQLAGWVRGDDRVELVDGSVEERRFVALYERAGRLVGVIGFNRPRPVMLYRNLIEHGVSFDQALAAEI